MRGDILGLERRRRWSNEDKLEIVLSVGVDGATVTQVAQRHDITRQQICTWRHALKKAGLLQPATGADFGSWYGRPQRLQNEPYWVVSKQISRGDVHDQYYNNRVGFGKVGFSGSLC